VKKAPDTQQQQKTQKTTVKAGDFDLHYKLGEIEI